MSEELKPCPFCGGFAIEREDGVPRCGRCLAKGPIRPPDTWNHRVAPPASPEVLGKHDGISAYIARAAKAEKALSYSRTTIDAKDAEIASLKAALKFYAEDDKLSVEAGILESVYKRPAAAALAPMDRGTK